MMHLQYPADAPPDAPTDDPADAPPDDPTGARPHDPAPAPADAPPDAPENAPPDAPADAPPDDPPDAPYNPLRRESRLGNNFGFVTEPNGFMGFFTGFGRVKNGHEISPARSSIGTQEPLAPVRELN